MMAGYTLSLNKGRGHSYYRLVDFILFSHIVSSTVAFTVTTATPNSYTESNSSTNMNTNANANREKEIEKNAGAKR